jgi:signal peptidase I
MKLTSGNWFKSADVNSGDMIEILNAGEKVLSEKYKYPDGNPVINYQFKVKIVKTGDEKLMNINKTSRQQLTFAYGDDTEKWIGKTAQVVKEMDRALKKYVIYLEPSTDLNADTSSKEKVPF